MSFSKNGTVFGVAFELEESITGRPLYPHVATKNVKVAVNFTSPVWCETPDSEGYAPIQEALEEHKFRAPKAPETYEECEVYMMIGLPASGKTTWAKKHCSQNKDKRFTILGKLL